MENPKYHKPSVHKVLAHSYAMYFILFLIGVSLDLMFRFKIFKTSVMVPTGASLIIFATLLIFWAQHTSRNLKKIR